MLSLQSVDPVEIRIEDDAVSAGAVLIPDADLYLDDWLFGDSVVGVVVGVIRHRF